MLSFILFGKSEIVIDVLLLEIVKLLKSNADNITVFRQLDVLIREVNESHEKDLCDQFSVFRMSNWVSIRSAIFVIITQLRTPTEK
jgi:hypothetical protein